MIQSFQCPVCGSLNPLGEPSCPNCGRSFVYNCPVCGNPIDNRYLRCSSCQTLFNWSKPVGQDSQLQPSNGEGMRIMYPQTRQSRVEINEVKQKPQSTSGSLTSRPIFWLMLMFGCMILVVLLLFLDKMINH